MGTQRDEREELGIVSSAQKEMGSGLFIGGVVATADGGVN